MAKDGTKKWSKKKKVFVIIISVILILILVAGIAAGIIIANMKKARESANVFAENPHGFANLGVRPNIDRMIDISSSDLNKMSADELKATAFMLYDTAMTNFKENDVVIYDNCLTSFAVMGLENKVNIDSVTFKTDEEYFRIDYRLKNTTPLLDAMPKFEKQINDSLELVLTERQYANVTQEKLIYQKVKNALLDDKSIPYADWENSKDYPVTEELRDKPVFSPVQEGKYSLTAHKVSVETMAKAEIKYHYAEGYYEVKISLDTTNPETSAAAVGNIREGSGDENANFDKLDITFTVWDSGFMRSYQMDEGWKAAALGIELLKFESMFHYNMYFSYSEEDTDLENYPDYLSFMEDLAQEE